MSVNGSLQTDEIALAVYLIIEGYDYDLRRDEVISQRKIAKCVWVFDDSSEIRELVQSYKDGKARVDPRRFAITWGAIRREMHDFLSV